MFKLLTSTLPVLRVSILPPPPFISRTLKSSSNAVVVPGIEMLKDDHRNIKNLFAKYEVEKECVEKGKLVNEIIRQLSIHTSVEERVLYPAVGVFLKGNKGLKLADHAVEEHHLISKLLYTLQSTKGSSNLFDKQVREVLEKVSSHIDEEEQVMFPALAKALNGRHVEEFGTKVSNARKFALTRPHPYIPHTPPINEKITPIIHLVDTVCDYFKEFPEDSTTKQVQPQQHEKG